MKKMILIGLCLALTSLQGLAFGGGGGAGLDDDDNELYFAYDERRIIQNFDTPEEAAEYQLILNYFKDTKPSFEVFSVELEQGVNVLLKDKSKSVNEFDEAMRSVTLTNAEIKNIVEYLHLFEDPYIPPFILEEDGWQYVLIKKIEHKCISTLYAVTMRLEGEDIRLRGKGSSDDKKLMKKEYTKMLKKILKERRRAHHSNDSADDKSTSEDEDSGYDGEYLL